MKIQGSVSRGLMLLLIAALVFIAACGNNNANTAPNNTPAPVVDNNAEPAAPSDEPKNLSIMWWGPDARHEATLKALDEYTA